MSIEIEKILRENKPEITESTLSAYVLNLQKLHDRLHGTKEFSDIEWLKQSDDVLTSLDQHCSSYLTVRNYLNSVIVALLNREDFADVIEQYQTKRDTLNDKYNEIQDLVDGYQVWEFQLKCKFQLHWQNLFQEFC